MGVRGEGTDPSPPGWGRGQGCSCVWSNGLHTGSAVPAWGPWSLQAQVPAPRGEGSPAEVSLAGAGVPSPARPWPGPALTLRGLEMGTPSDHHRLGDHQLLKSRSHLVCAGDGVSRGVSGRGDSQEFPPPTPGLCRGLRGLPRGVAVVRPLRAGALDAPTSTPPEASPGAGGPGRWRGSPRGCTSGQR